MLIFGNGAGQDEDVEPQPTRGIFGDLFGLGPLIKMMTDPAMLASAQAMMGAVAAGGEAAQRLEAKLDLLLKAQGHDVEALNKQFADASPSTAIMRAAFASLPDGGASFRDRPASLASPLIDDGSGEDAPRDRSPSRPHGRGHKR